MHGLFGESSTNPITFDDTDVQVKSLTETYLKETPQNIASKEQMKKIEKLKLVCKILVSEDNPHSQDKKESEIMTEEERKCTEDDEKFIKEHGEHNKLEQEAKEDEELHKKVAKAAQEKEYTWHEKEAEDETEKSSRRRSWRVNK